MKPIRDSFLFFLCALLYTAEVDCHVPQQNDSLHYYYLLVKQPGTRTDLHKAYVYFENRRKEHSGEKDTLNVIFCLRLIADIQNKIGFLYESEASAVEALNLLDHLKGKDTLVEPRIGIYNHLGMICRQRDEYGKALYYYDRVLNIATNENHKYTTWNNKSNVYKDQQNYTAAITGFTKLYEHALKEKDTLRMARALDNLGLVQSRVNMSEGLLNMKKALDIRRSKHHVSGIITSYLHLIEYYRDRGETEQAVAIAEEARKITDSSGNNPKWRSHILSAIIDLKNDPDILEFKRYTDSVVAADQLQRNKYVSAKYNFIAQEQKARESELQRVREKSRRIVYQFVGLFLLIIAILVVLYLRMKHRKEIQQKVNATEMRISQKMHDEVANDMYRLMTNIQTYPGIPGEILDDLEDIYTHTRDISREINTPDLNADYGEILKDLLLQFQTDKTNIVIKGLSEISWKTAREDEKYAIYKVLLELMVNMKKHSNATMVLLQFGQAGGATVVEYSDNGNGCDLQKGNGLTNAENRIKLVNGTITFVSAPKKGFKAKMVV